MPTKRICVYAGSCPGARPAYREAARELGRALAERELGLVYGGAAVGLMGELADAVLAHGGEAIGVLPRFLGAKEIAHPGLTELRFVETMHERKALMAVLASGFVALPGGIGTLEELFEIYAWAQLERHDKPCGLLNVAGYYDHLLAFLDHSVQERFVTAPHRDMLLVREDPGALLDAFERYVPPVVPKWLDRS